MLLSGALRPVFLFLVVEAYCLVGAFATVSQSPIWNHNMVLQRDLPIQVFGNGTVVGEAVTVTFKSQTKNTTVGADGKWQVTLDPEATDAVGRTLTIQGTGNTLTYNNVLVGEVWMASGQSNMWYGPESCFPADWAEAQTTAANYPDIRIFRQSNGGGSGDWQASGAPSGLDPLVAYGSYVHTSAFGYFFSRKLQQQLEAAEGREVPVGLINASNGSRTIQAFLPNDIEARDPELGAVSGDNGGGGTDEFKRVSFIFPFTLKGVLWLQGESNANNTYEYRRQMPLLVSYYRELWQRPEMWFGIAQIHNYIKNFQTPVPNIPSATPPQYDDQAEIREVHDMTTRYMTNTVFSNTIDAGLEFEPDSIHYRARKTAGERMALRVAQETYGLGDRPEFPSFTSHKVSGNQIICHFDDVGGGLTINPPESANFIDPAHVVIAGRDRVFYYADTVQIVGDTLVASSSQVAEPVALRYAWDKNPGASIKTSEGFPVSPFRTDSWCSASGSDWPNNSTNTNGGGYFTTDNPYECRLLSPVAQQQFPDKGRVVLAANASAEFSDILKIEFFDVTGSGEVKLGEATGMPAYIYWDDVAPGSYTILARATDEHGITFDSPEVAMTVGSYDSNPTLHTLTVNGGVGGTKTPAGQIIRIRAAEPIPGKRFLAWTGDTAFLDEPGEAFTALVMPAQNVNLTATYEDAPVLVDFDFTGTNPGANIKTTPWTAAKFANPFIVVSGISAGNGMDALWHPLPNRLGLRIAEKGSTLISALANKDYISFSIQPAAGKVMSLSGSRISFVIDRVGNQATPKNGYDSARSCSVFSSFGGFTAGAELHTEVIPSMQGAFNKTVAGATPWRVNVTIPPGYDNLNIPVEFRVYFYNANNSTGDSFSPYTDFGLSSLSIMGTAELMTNNPPSANGLVLNGVPKVTSTITRSYTYSDTENDPEGGTLHQWYISSDSNFDALTDTLVSSSTSFVLRGLDEGKYLFLKVSPIAVSGTAYGTPVVTAPFGPVLAADGQLNSELGADADTYVQTNDTVNQGAATSLVSRGSYGARALYRFDLPDLTGRTVIQATLRLTLGTNTNQVLETYQLADPGVDWDEMTVLNATAPASGAFINSTTTPSINNTSFDVDVTNYVAANTGLDKISMATTTTGNVVINTHSKEATTATRRPKLILKTIPSGSGGNTAPDVGITAPATGSSVTQGSSVSFTGTVTDAQEPGLGASATWTSSINGAIGTGTSVSTSSLSVGTHTITFAVTDAGGLSDSAQISLTVTASGGGNTAPDVAITAPANGSSVTQGSNVTLTGTVTDAEQPTLGSSATWTSSINGALGTGTSISTSSLSVGTHTITFAVTDAGGLSDSAQITLTVNPPANTAPDVAITAPANGSSATQGSNVTFTGTVTDTQEPTLGTSATWTSSINGALGTGTSVSTSSLSVGTHTITFAVTDAGGLSDSAQITLTVNAPGDQTVTLSPVADAETNGGSPDTNYGSSNVIASRPTQNRYPYMKFDLSSINGTITSATLRIAQQGSTAATVNFYAVADDSWTESGITFNNRPAISSTLIGSGPTPAADRVYMTVDVTAYIQAQRTADGVASLSWNPTTNTLISFWSQQYTGSPTYRPELVVTYATPISDPYTTWATNGGLSGGDADPLATPHGDGMPNLLKYALGGNPSSSPSSLEPALSSSNSSLTLTFDRIADPELLYEVYASNDLADWGSAPIWSSSGAQNTPGPVTVTDPSSTGPRRFLRLRVSVP